MICTTRRILVFPLLFVLFISGIHAQSDFYWEQPEIFSPAQGSFPVSAFNGTLSVVAWQETQPGRVSGPDGTGDGRIRVAAAVKSSASSGWRVLRSVGGPYVYSGTEPAILSAVVDRGGRIFLAAAASAAETEILVSEDQGESFQTYRVNSGSESSIAPRIFPLSGGGYILFVTRGREQSLSIYYALSQDGYSWSALQPFVENPALQLNFLPTLASLNGVDYVIFQSFVAGSDSVPAFQLYLKTSSDGGRTWTPSRLITDFRDSRINDTAAAERFDNQRAHLSVQGNGLFLVWERRYGVGSPRIYGASLRPDGSLSAQAEQINSVEAYCNNPIGFQYQGQTTVVWFDNRRGSDRGFIARRGPLEWQNYELAGATAAATFARPVVDGEGLNVFWQSQSRGMDRIFSLVPDSTMAVPRLTAQNFVPGRPTRGDRARISWTVPADSSGIYGFAYSWGRTAGELPPAQIMAHAGISSLEQIADEDGAWYFSLSAQDFAGNWSKPVTVEYVRDMTPPPPVDMPRPSLDEGGYLPSNTFSMQWEAPSVSDIAGYTWALDYLGPLEPFESMDESDFEAAAQEQFTDPPVPPPQIMGRDSSASFVNQDNGVWRFSVYPVDMVGNVGDPSSFIFRMNKYVPHTYITYVNFRQDEQGILSVEIIGRGFSDGGRVTRVILDRNGQPPYDREYLLDEDFSVLSDREIGNLTIDDINEGIYRVGVEHPLRGLYMSAPLVSVDETGTIKFGDFSRNWRPSWAVRDAGRFVVDVNFLILGGIILFCLAGLIASVRGIGNVVAESTAIRVEALALITGDLMPSEKKKRLTRIKRRGGGLRLKLASFTIILVLLVVVMVSIPLYYMMTRNQERTLLQGLWDRSRVLLEGIASSARAYLPSASILELGFLPAQMASVPEARYVTITGYGSNSAVYDDRVWATNDPEILSKIDTAEFQPGVSRLRDELSPRLETISGELGDRARVEVSELSASISSLTREALSLALRSDAESRQRMADIQVTTRSLETRLNERLTEVASEIGSEPAFSVENFSRKDARIYVFFKPVMYRQGSDDIYFRGLVRLEVSVDSIIADIVEGQWDLLKVILLVALSAIVIGAAGALILSTLIIRPIRTLVSHVERIRDTEDKSKLEGVDIEIKTQDEIAVLGNTINDMTHGLVKAAQASQDLTIGKEIQKKFIPLDVNRAGDKITSGYKDTKNVEFFGYYEGAKGVSGDYFDYQDLDGRYYAIIKCDVAGKGIPAALIMIQVATMFLNHFKQWKPTEKGMHIEEVVYQINDFIETLGFKGRFAAFTLALFDSQTGLIRFCNAGDNIVHWYDASEGKMKTITLKETPATGVLPNFLVESKGGYTVQTLTIDHGDILFLYTDGIEEAKRKFRDAEFKEILCTEGPNDTPHANHVAGQGDEEMGPDRVEAIINAVMNREIYTLYKYHNPEGEIELTFDFSDCQGKVEEAIMAMVSVEKMFRCYKDPKADEDSRVLVDKKVDGFLKEHFLQYRNYCSFTRENPENDGYMYYTHVKEDAQYDDLTIIGINRK